MVKLMTMAAVHRTEATAVIITILITTTRGTPETTVTSEVEITNAATTMKVT